MIFYQQNIGFFFRFIKGFISKGDCHRLLFNRDLGTFLFRFSDSTLGAVSISCYTRSKFTGIVPEVLVGGTELENCSE